MAVRPRHGLSLCAGGGGLDMGLMLAEPGFHTRAFVEWEEYPRSVLIAGQRAGYFAPAPIWDDVTTFDARPFRGAFDTILAGYPCQPFSQAGQRKGADDERHLWPDVARIIREVDPEWVFLENVAGHVSLGLETVLRNLWDMGLTPAVGLFSAAETGAPHERLRVFIVAHANGGSASAERQQRSGQQRFHAPGGRSGRHVENPERAGAGGGAPPADQQGRDALDGRGTLLRRGDGSAGADRPAADGQGDRTALDDASGARRADAGRGSDERSDRIECGQSLPCDGRPELVDAQGIGRGEGRAGTELRIWRDATLASAGGAMADTEGPDGGGKQPAGGTGRRWPGPSGDGAELANTSEPRLEGREWRGAPDERDGSPAHGSTAERGRPCLFPPGPGDGAAWSAVIGMAPYLAPSLSISDVKRAAEHFAQMVARGELAETQAQSFVRLCADGLASRSRALRLLGNGVFPLGAANAWRALAAAHGLRPVDMDAASGSGCTANPDDPVVEAAE